MDFFEAAEPENFSHALAAYRAERARQRRERFANLVWLVCMLGGVIAIAAVCRWVSE